MGEQAPEVWFPNLGIKIAELNNVAFNLFGLPVYWYGLIICGGIIAGILLLLHELKRTNQSTDAYMDIVLISIVACIVGARLYYVIFAWDEFKDDLSRIFAVREGGLAIFGAIIAAVLVVAIYSRKKKLDFFLLADTFAPSLLLGQIIGRWGNFINKEAYGGFCDNIFALRYIASQAKAVPQSLLDKAITAYGTQYIQVHPTFLYESLWNLGLLIFILIMKKKKKFSGQIMAIYLMGYSAGRVWIEGLRTDQLIIGHTGIAVSQVLSAAILVGGIIILLLRRKTQSKEAI